MRRSYTAVIEQGNVYAQDFATEPFEAGWASEARWFVRILAGEGRGEDVRIVAQTEISPDGLVWMGNGDDPIRMSAAPDTMASCLVTGFGHWLRLNVKLEGAARGVKFLIYLALKE
ncbi:MAG: hypothetical protein JSR91_07585 [Proteobacteria bacterium]|nr:hypothetical protein [Pseudomonadota bacterium]